MRRVIVESPYQGDTIRNIEYARMAVRDSLMRNESPLASHLLYTQPGILCDEVHAARNHGIAAGLAWLLSADAMVMYVDLGISAGMRAAEQVAKNAGIPVEIRRIHQEP